MWALIKDNKIEEIIRFPRSIQIEGIKHPRAIFNTWTWEQLNAIGIYEVLDNGTKGNNNFEYTSQPTWTFNKTKKNVSSSYTITEKALDDSNAVDEDGNNILDADGNQVINYGLKHYAKERAKQQANSFISRFNWLVERSIYDSSKAIPDAVKTYVASIRTDCSDIETAIDGATTMKKFKALYQDTVNSDGEVTEINRINRWTDDKTIKEYIR